MSILRSKYPYQSTNIYNVTASRTTGFSALNPFEKMERARQVIFIFDYPTPENVDADEFKAFFEKMFIGKFIDDYFKYETFERWQLAFYSKMLEVMPIYNAKLSNFFYDNKKELFAIINETDSNSTNTNKSITENKNIASAFPSNLNRAGVNINNVNYANNGAILNDENNTNGENTNHTVNKTINNFENILKFDAHFKNIFSDLLKEFNPLFSAVIRY